MYFNYWVETPPSPTAPPSSRSVVSNGNEMKWNENENENEHGNENENENWNENENGNDNENDNENENENEIVNKKKTPCGATTEGKNTKTE